MSNYVKSTNFTSKDTLPSGDALKKVKGTELDVEFNNIASAISSKADLVSPTFTGTPFAPTAAAGTNTTQLATTAFVTTALQALYPVGSVYINASVTTNPATLLGFGTWTEIGAGRVLVGQDTSDASFDTMGETGGSKDAIVVSHNHTTSAAGSHSHTTNVGKIFSYSGDAFFSGTNEFAEGPRVNGSTNLTSSTASDHTHTISTEGSSGTNANLQPYIVVKMWRRVS